MKAAPSFLSSFHRLVLSVMHEGRQKGDRGTISCPPLPYICIYSRRGDAEQDEVLKTVALKLSALSVLYEKLGMSFVVLWA